jgi:hypothetical protein
VVRLTEDSGASFPVSITDLQARLFVYQGIKDAIGLDQYQVPREAFAHTDPGAIVKLEARTINGDPLPSWLNFDPLSGMFRGVPPGGESVTLDLILTAQDAEGREASVEFKLEMGVNDAARENAPRPNRAGADPLLSGTDDADEDVRGNKESVNPLAKDAKLAKERAAKLDRAAEKHSASSFADQIRAAKLAKDPVLAKALDAKTKQANRLGS